MMPLFFVFNVSDLGRLDIENIIIALIGAAHLCKKPLIMADERRRPRGHGGGGFWHLLGILKKSSRYCQPAKEVASGRQEVVWRVCHRVG